ncbi:uncharacterized protein [Argopecten irradians]|uniref:uncharacterized protein n=1 Tax=Argopecten irradians TaxID=31199 RepID=UPI00371E8A47
MVPTIEDEVFEEPELDTLDLIFLGSVKERIFRRRNNNLVSQPEASMEEPVSIQPEQSNVGDPEYEGNVCDDVETMEEAFGGARPRISMSKSEQEDAVVSDAAPVLEGYKGAGVSPSVVGGHASTWGTTSASQGGQSQLHQNVMTDSHPSYSFPADDTDFIRGGNTQQNGHRVVLSGSEGIRPMGPRFTSTPYQPGHLNQQCRVPEDTEVHNLQGSRSNAGLVHNQSLFRQPPPRQPPSVQSHFSQPPPMQLSLTQPPSYGQGHTRSDDNEGTQMPPARQAGTYSMYGGPVREGIYPSVYEMPLGNVGVGGRGNNSVYDNTPRRKEKEPQPYDSHKVNFRDFLTHFEHVAQWNRWDGYEQAQQLAMCLRGNDVHVLSQLTFSQLSDYAQLKQALIQRFAPPGREYAHGSEFKSRRRVGRESLVEYGESLRNLSVLAFPDLSTREVERRSIEQFVEGLGNFEIQRYVQFSHPTTLEEAVSRAIEHESFVNRHGVPTRKPKGEDLVNDFHHVQAVSNENEGGGNPVASVTDDLKTLLLEQFDTLNKTLSQRFARSSKRGRRDPTQIVCYACGKMGHLSYDCKHKAENLEEGKNQGN